jgi:hypothetical protein
MTCERFQIRLGEVPDIRYEERDYDDVRDPEMRRFLEDYERDVVKGIKSWPARYKHVSGNQRLLKIFGLDSGRMTILLNLLRDKKVITPIEVRVRRNQGPPVDLYFDPDRYRVLGAYAHASSALDNPQSVDVIARRAREMLGEGCPLAELLKVPERAVQHTYA